MSFTPIILYSRVRPLPVFFNHLKMRQRDPRNSIVSVSAIQSYNSSSQYSSSSSSSSQFKSSLSLDKLYPNSSLNLAKQTKIPDQKDPNKFNGYIPMGTIERLDMSFNKYMHEMTYDGQNQEFAPVTAVTLRFHVESAEWLPQPIRENFLKKYQNVISKDGYFTIKSDRTFTRHLNTADALEKLREMIRACEPQQAPIEPIPETGEMIRRKREKLTRQTLHQKGRAQLR